jgi:hypothetical protein
MVTLVSPWGGIRALPILFGLFLGLTLVSFSVAGGWIGFMYSCALPTIFAMPIG